jgi:hypothetical protein
MVFHSQSTFSLTIKKLCKLTQLKYSDEREKKKDLKKVVKKALEDISMATDKTISGELKGDLIIFSFSNEVKNLPAKKDNWGVCPKCSRGVVVSGVSLKDGQRYWFCNRGKEDCGYVSNNEPKRVLQY